MKNAIRKLKTLAKVVLGKESYIKPDLRCVKERYGSDYGGWDVVTANINSRSVVYSFGIGEDVSFDIELIEKFNLIIHGFDPTPKSIEWVKKQNLTTHFILHEYGIAAFDGNVLFNPPENPNHISHTLLERPSTKAKTISVQVKRLQTIMNELGHDRIDILKMDVEGAEYDVITDICQSEILPQQVLIEFHHRFPNVDLAKTRNAIEQLQKMGYRLFSISATNEEFCFIRNSGL